MNIDITEDILSITELKQKTNSVMRKINNSGRPVILTINGRAEAVLIGAKEYQKIQKAIEVMKEILLAEKDVVTGKVKEAGAFFKDFRNAKKV